MMISKFIRVAKIIFLVSIAVSVTPAYSKNMPCNVKLEFDSNSKGSVANYTPTKKYDRPRCIRRLCDLHG